MDGILERVPCCTAGDEERFRAILAPLIEDGTVPRFKAFQVDEAKRKKREKKAAKEAREAEELAKQLGLGEGQSLESAILARRGGGAGGGKNEKSKHEDQMDGIADALLLKYGGGGPASKGRKANAKAETEPSEEEFLAAQSRLKKPKK